MHFIFLCCMAIGSGGSLTAAPTAQPPALLAMAVRCACCQGTVFLALQLPHRCRIACKRLEQSREEHKPASYAVGPRPSARADFCRIYRLCSMEVAAQLSSLLEELELGQTLLPDTLGRCCDFKSACTQLAADGEALPEAERLVLRSALNAAGSRLAQLEIQLAEHASSLGPDPSHDALVRVVGNILPRLQAGYALLHAGAELCRLLGDAAATQGLQRAVCLLQGCGRGMLRSSQQFVAANADFGDTLLELVQLMRDLWSLDPSHLATMVPPQDLLSWLADATAAVKAVHGPLLDRGSPPPADCLSALADLCSMVLTHSALRDHRQLLRQDRGLASRLVALLEPGLPAAAVALALPAEQRPAGFTWKLAGSLATVLAAAGLKEALWAHLAGCGGSRDTGSSGGGGFSAAPLRLLSASTRLLELSAEQAGYAAAAGGYAFIRGCSKLLCQACGRLAADVAEREQQGPWRHSQEHARVIGALRRAVTLMPRVLQLLGCGGLVRPQEGQQEQQPEPPAARRQVNESADLLHAWDNTVLTLLLVMLRPRGRPGSQATATDPALVVSGLQQVPV
ncbi:hypothetical protein ABPG75_002766 [Micractinium tetrahymenae]